MRRCLTALLVVGLISLNNRDAAAQPSAGDVAAFLALGSTPVGALTPIVVSNAKGAIAGRYSHYSVTGTSSDVLGGSYYFNAGSTAKAGLTAGYRTCEGCDATMMLGGQVHSKLWNNAAAKSNTALSINLQGDLGWAHATDLTMFSAAVGVPFAISVEQASKNSFSAFVTPGFGWGRSALSGFDAESGTRPMIGAGAAWNAAAGYGIHAGFQKIMLEDQGSSIGVGFSWKLGN